MGNILKRTAAGAASLALAFSVVAATDAPAEAAAGCKITYGNYRTIHAGSKGAKARSAECLLSKAGYAATVNGRFSTADVAELKKFQLATKLQQTGTVNRQTWSALISRGPATELGTGSRGSSVRRLEAALRASGFKIKVNSRFRADTARAVSAIQKAKGWSVTGRSTSAVWQALQTGQVVQLAQAIKKAPAAKTGSSKGKKALAFAKRQLGDKYRYGGNGPNAWDCSGLTRAAWKKAGVKLPHSAAGQFRRGKKVSKSNLRPGDLVFFYSGIRHVAIYAGNGKVIHASRPGKPVAYIKMKYMPYKGARRPG